LKGRIIRNILTLSVFFAILYLSLNILNFLEKKTTCFPVTVITTDKDSTDSLLRNIDICRISVEVEKMTFDSAIFNHYEKFPIKDIYFYSLQIPYSEWERIKSLDDAITETNPFLESYVSSFINSKIKYYTIAFVVLIFIGIIFLVRISPSWKTSRKEFKLAAFFNSLFFLIFSVPLMVFNDLVSKTFILLLLFLICLLYVVILIIIFKLMQNREIK